MLHVPGTKVVMALLRMKKVERHLKLGYVERGRDHIGNHSFIESFINWR